MALENLKEKSKDYSKLFSRLNALYDSDIELVEEFVRYVKLKKKRDGIAPSIPCEIFEKSVSSFESIVRFLREQHELSYKEIALLLKRSVSTIGVTYKNAKRKSKLDYKFLTPKIRFKADIFSSNLTVLEAVVFELKEGHGFSLKEISRLVKRNYQTVWTVYQHARGKVSDER